MATFSFTPEGVQEWQKNLYSSSEEEILAASKYLASDLRGYVIENFDLDESQQDYLKSLPEKDALSTGWFMASAVIFQQPIEMADPTSPATARAKKKKKLEVKASTTTNTSTGETTATVSIGMTWEWD